MIWWSYSRPRRVLLILANSLDTLRQSVFTACPDSLWVRWNPAAAPPQPAHFQLLLLLSFPHKLPSLQMGPQPLEVFPRQRQWHTRQQWATHRLTCQSCTTVDPECASPSRMLVLFFARNKAVSGSNCCQRELAHRHQRVCHLPFSLKIPIQSHYHIARPPESPTLLPLTLNHTPTLPQTPTSYPPHSIPCWLTQEANVITTVCRDFYVISIISQNF